MCLNLKTVSLVVQYVYLITSIKIILTWQESQGAHKHATPKFLVQFSNAIVKLLTANRCNKAYLLLMFKEQ